MLSSADIKYYSSLKQKKYREETGKFLIEGFHLIEECLSSSYFLDMIILRDDVELKDFPEIRKKINGKKIRVEILPDRSFRKLSETESSQGIIGVVSKKDMTQKIDSKIVIALDRINDPGNLGTILRTAYWFGIEAILISGNSVDIYNSKVIRASQGGIFHVNVKNDINLLQELINLKDSGYKVYLLTLSAKNDLNGINKNENAVFVFGNEADGISENIINSGFEEIRISGFSRCESLNVAVSAGIVLHKITS